MSGLLKSDLQKLSLKQLEKFATGVDGEDLALVNEVIAEKSAGKQGLGEMDSGVATGEKNVSEKKKKIAKTDEEKNAEAELKAKQKEERDQMLAKKKEEAEKRAVEKQKELEERKQRMEEMMEKKAAAKIEKEERRKEAQKAKMEALAAKKENETITEEKIAAIRARLQANFEGDPKDNVDLVRRCMLLKLTNDEIKAISGFTTKFVCDTTWRLERNVSFYSMQKRFVEKTPEEVAAEIEVTETKEETAE